MKLIEAKGCGYCEKAPILTIFIGGNHEASGFLQELPNGGWVAPRIFYMGHANVVQFAGLRIAGLSGIFNKHHYYTDVSFEGG
uniref:Uncharacterized protein n=1 Tax=Parascaris equorum TaxID=6256 RepID=A0A914RSI1_PAREQ